MNKTDTQILLSHATDMMKKAYAPYSKFHVGAALQTDPQKVFGGCNIESASFGLTMCAERVALFHAIANGHKQFTHLALVTETGAYPCGACRQLLYEFCPNFIIIIATPTTIINTTTIQELLPHGFGNKDFQE